LKGWGNRYGGGRVYGSDNALEKLIFLCGWLLKKGSYLPCLGYEKKEAKVGVSFARHVMRPLFLY
jgi:hypothetical protein